jgi:23S rRNA-/tRNA-specific pseudouridylate synthase
MIVGEVRRRYRAAMETALPLPSVVHETPTWLVLDKPAGWHTVRGKTEAGEGGGGVLEVWLAEQRPECKDLPESGLVHRLDRDTSGCVVVAKDAATHDDLSRRFREGLGVRKFYLARCVTGLREEGSATLFFTSRHKGSIKITVKEMGEARDAGRFRWRVLARDRSRGDVVELELIGPGKRHELRGGCAFLGHPLVGDELYGGVAAAGLCLHASQVEIDGERVVAAKPRWAEA